MEIIKVDNNNNSTQKNYIKAERDSSIGLIQTSIDSDGLDFTLKKYKITVNNEIKQNIIFNSPNARKVKQHIIGCIYNINLIIDKRNASKSKNIKSNINFNNFPNNISNNNLNANYNNCSNNISNNNVNVINNASFFNQNSIL